MADARPDHARSPHARDRDRRRRIRHAFTLLAGALAFVVAGLAGDAFARQDAPTERPAESSPAHDTAPAKPPNIVVVMVDDWGWQDTSVPFASYATRFNERYRTPALDHLAATGAILTNGYASAPVCTPSRVALMTGQVPARHHATWWTLRRDRDTSNRHPVLSPPKWKVNGLQPEDGPTLASLLNDAGYRTIHVGKAHWGAHDTLGSDPRRLGFEVNIAGHGSGAPGSFYGRHRFMNAKSTDDFSKPSIWDVPGLERWHDQDVYLTDVLAIEAVERIDESIELGRPFFLHFAPYAVHTPIMANERFLERYTLRGLDPKEAAYATMVESVDAAIGSILEALDRHGIADETIVIVTGDNGGLSAHARGDRPHTHNEPLRSGKGSAYEGGTRVPWFVRWPGTTTAGARLTTPVVTHDLFPTLLAVADVSIPADHAIDGVDFRDTLRRPRVRVDDADGASPPPTDDQRAFLWHQPHQWGGRGPGIEPFSAIRVGEWKLLFFHADARFELYDLANDLSEERDLVRVHPAIARMLGIRLGEEMKRVEAQRSIVTDTNEPVRWPDEIARLRFVGD